MALRRAVMLQDLYGDKIGRGFMDEVEILGHSDQRMCVCVCGGYEAKGGKRKMTSLFRTSIPKVGQWP